MLTNIPKEERQTSK